MAELPNIAPALPEIFLALVAMALLLFGAFRKGDSTGGIVALSVIAMVLTAFLVISPNGGRVVTFAGMYAVDSFTVFSKILVLIGTALTLIMSVGWLKAEKIERPEYPVLVLFALVGMLLMISANNLIALYLGLELQSLSLYVLAAFHRESGRSTEAGLKYFILGSLASGMLLYGASLIYGFAGTTGFDPLASALSQGAPTGVVVGLVFVLAGLSFKITAAPFHMWAPDVYEGAPTPVTAFFAVGPKIAAFSLLVRVLFGPFAGAVDQWHQVIVVLSAMSMVVGAFGAIAQSNIKRLLAYSSIGHVGYVLLGVAVGTVEGVRGVLIYLTIYMFTSVGAFTVILSMRQKGRLLEGIDDLAGVSKTHPMMALALSIFMFSMAGIPPLAGFWAKWYVFLPAIEKGYIALSVLGVLTSVVGAFYYIRVVKVMYFDEPAEVLDTGIGPALGIVMGGSALLVGLFMVLPAPLVSGAESAAAVFFGG